MITKTRLGPAGGVMLLTGLLAACAQTPPALTPEEEAQQRQAIEALSAGRPAYLKSYYAEVVRGGDRDAVRHWLDLGKTAMDRGDHEAAAEAFDEAIKRISAVYADDPQAEKARSVWHEEAVKDFKGEPYERAMAFLYRGVLDLLAGDYENARAGFKGALIQDSFAEDDRHRQDFASAAWLVGWTNHCLGDAAAAAEAFAEARSFRAALPVPAPEDRLLVLMEAGRGPLKESWGEYNEKLAYIEQAPPRHAYVASAAADVPGRPMWLAEDLFYQATTRGGRQMDDVLAQKADTKAVTGAVGGGMTVAGVGMMYSGNNDAAMAGAAVAIVGLLAQAAAASMTAEADIRQWRGLPHSLYLTALPLPQDDDAAAPPLPTLSFAATGAPALLKPEAVQTARHGTCAVAWMPAYAVRLEPPPVPVTPPSPVTPAAADAPGIASPTPSEPTTGNCRTRSGKLRTLRPEICEALDGVVLTAE